MNNEKGLQELVDRLVNRIVNSEAFEVATEKAITQIINNGRSELDEAKIAEAIIKEFSDNGDIGLEDV